MRLASSRTSIPRRTPAPALIKATTPRARRHEALKVSLAEGESPLLTAHVGFTRDGSLRLGGVDKAPHRRTSRPSPRSGGLEYFTSACWSGRFPFRHELLKLGANGRHLLGRITVS